MRVDRWNEIIVCASDNYQLSVDESGSADGYIALKLDRLSLAQRGPPGLGIVQFVGNVVD